MEQFPERLKSLRTARRLSARTLAELCGLSKGMISRYERGECEPTAHAVCAIADFFEMTTDALLGREN